MSGRPPAPIEGIVAFTFAEGSDQAETLVPQYNTSAIDASLSFDELASSRTADLRARGEIAPADDNQGASKGADAEAQAAGAPSGETESMSDNAFASESQNRTPEEEELAPPEQEQELAPPPADASQAEQELAPPPADASQAEQELAPPQPHAPDAASQADSLEAGQAPAGSLALDAAATSVGAPSVGAPSFGTPSFDVPSFQAPSFDAPLGDVPPASNPQLSDASGAAAASTDRASPQETSGEGSPGTDADASASLPAHLALPSFPKFDINFDPSAALGEAPSEPEAPQPSADAAALGQPGVSDGAEAPDGASPPPGMPAHLIPGALPGAAPGGPPKPPPTPPKAPPKPAAPTMPALPNLGLPDLAISEPKREVTLLGDEAAQELAEELQQKRSALPLILVGLLLVGAIVGLGVWQKDTIVGFITPQKDTAPTITAKEKAEAALAEGVLAANDGKWGKAIKHYQEAIDLEPKLSQAHLRMAVAFATTKKQGRAVEHYRKYVELEPDAPNAKEVQKIIDDFEKAQSKKEPTEEDNGKKKRRSKRKR